DRLFAHRGGCCQTSNNCCETSNNCCEERGGCLSFLRRLCHGRFGCEPTCCGNGGNGGNGCAPGAVPPPPGEMIPPPGQPMPKGNGNYAVRLLGPGRCLPPRPGTFSGREPRWGSRSFFV